MASNAKEKLKANLRRCFARYEEQVRCRDGNVLAEKEQDLEVHAALETLCDKVWLQFSDLNQKSPSRRNNNVHHRKPNRQRLHSAKGSTAAQSELLNSRSGDKTVRTEDVPHVQKTCKQNVNACNNEPVLFSRFGLAARTMIKAILLLTQVVTVLVYTVILMAVLYCMIVLHKPTQTFISRNTQDLIYPFMRASRLLAIPFVKRFPYLSSLYDDSCLVSNPYFTMTNIDCWPCETARSIVDLTGFSNFSAAYYGSGIPFIVKDSFPVELTFDAMKAMLEDADNGDFFTQFHNHFGRESKSNVDGFKPPTWKRQSHFRWKINRVSTARTLRKYFPKPYFVPNGTEVSVQHFLFLDLPESPIYSLPITEFANVFFIQASGARVVVLVPTSWCKSSCKMLSILLQPKDVLFYNWLYWNPKSGPAPSSNLSVSYIGSFY